MKRQLVLVVLLALVNANCVATARSNEQGEDDVDSFADLQQMQPNYTPMPQDAPTGEAAERLGPVVALVPRPGSS